MEHAVINDKLPNKSTWRCCILTLLDMTHFRKTHFYGTSLDAALDDISKKILTVPHFTVHHLSKITNFRKRNLNTLDKLSPNPFWRCCTWRWSSWRTLKIPNLTVLHLAVLHSRNFQKNQLDYAALVGAALDKLPITNSSWRTFKIPNLTVQHHLTNSRKNLLDRAARDGEALDELSKINLTVLHLTNLLDGAAPLDDVRNNGLDCAAFERLPKKPNSLRCSSWRTFTKTNKALDDCWCKTCRTFKKTQLECAALDDATLD